MDQIAETLEIDEQINALDYLSKVQYFVIHAKQDIFFYKWALLALHSTLYSFAIINLTHTDGRCFIIKPKNKKAREKHILYTDRHEVSLINLLEAIEYCKDPQKATFLRNESITLTNEESKVIFNLNKMRNDFQHYIPMLWSIDIDYIRELLRNGLLIVNKIIEANSNVTQLWTDNKERALTIISETVSELSNSKN